MENLKKSFEKINSKYISKKNHFTKVLEKWWTKGKLDLHKKALSLMQEAESLSKEIQESFVTTVEGEPNKILLNKKIKNFKKCYKKLNEMTKSSWRQWIEAIVVAGSLVFILRTYIFGLYHVPTGSAEPTILVGDRLWGNKFTYYFDKIKHGDTIIFDNPEFVFDRPNTFNYYWQKYVGFPIPLLGLSAGPDNWTKRVIAVPGDVIEGRIEDDKTVIYRNGKKLDESGYVNPYPLIRLVKTTGFIKPSSIAMLPIPSFLRKTIKMVKYTYVPSKTFSKQPFYYIKPNEVVRKADNTPFLEWPYTPTYEYDQINGFSGKSIDEFGPIRIPKDKYWVMGDSRKNSRDSRFWGLLDKSLIHGKASFIIYSVDSEEPLWIFELLKHPIDFWTKSVRWNRFLKWIK
ncbi:signal peptidase I [Candidatus Dependentiae bacterium]|nr:signal peptidase I [Candidatus Dependentiae bacterium]